MLIANCFGFRIIGYKCIIMYKCKLVKFSEGGSSIGWFSWNYILIFRMQSIWMSFLSNGAFSPFERNIFTNIFILDFQQKSYTHFVTFKSVLPKLCGIKRPKWLGHSYSKSGDLMRSLLTFFRILFGVCEFLVFIVSAWTCFCVTYKHKYTNLN